MQSEYRSDILGCLRVKYFPLPIGDMNCPSYNKFTEGIYFFPPLLGCLRVNYFTLPIGDMNSPSYHNFTVDFIWQVTQTLGRALKS